MHFYCHVSNVNDIIIIILILIIILLIIIIIIAHEMKHGDDNIHTTFMLIGLLMHTNITQAMYKIDKRATHKMIKEIDTLN